MFRRVPQREGFAAGFFTLSSILLMSHFAVAQPVSPGKPTRSAQPEVSTAPATIAIDDPMLAPVTPAPHMLTTWREALTYITQRSIEVATAFQEIQRAEGLRRQALAAALPSLTAQGTVSGQVIQGTIGSVSITDTGIPVLKGTTVPTTNPSVVGSLQASVPLVVPRAWYAVKTADMSVASSKLSYDDKRRTVLTTVANAIVAVITSERVAEINRNGLRSALQRLDLTQRKFKLGDATRLDVLRAEQDATTARATLVSGDESLRQSREALGLALGFSEGCGVPSTISLGDIEQTVGGVCAAGKLEDRSDLRQLKSDIAVAERGITDAWLAFSPTVTLAATASLNNNAQAQPGNQVGAFSISGILSIPLWDGGARYGSVRVARVTHEEAKLKLEATLRSASISVAQALRGVAVAEQARAVSTNARDLAKESARLAQRSYEVGTGTSFDLVNTAQQERAAELDLAVKEFQVVSARLSAVLSAANCTY